MTSLSNALSARTIEALYRAARHVSTASATAEQMSAKNPALVFAVVRNESYDGAFELYQAGEIVASVYGVKLWEAEEIWSTRGTPVETEALGLDFAITGGESFSTNGLYVFMDCPPMAAVYKLAQDRTLERVQAREVVKRRCAEHLRKRAEKRNRLA